MHNVVKDVVIDVCSVLYSCLITAVFSHLIPSILAYERSGRSAVQALGLSTGQQL